MDVETGVCPVCRETCRLTTDGKVWMHSPCAGGGAWPLVCQFCHVKPGLLLIDSIHTSQAQIISCRWCAFGGLAT